jgi:UDP-2,3-diacylglucosamine hydrolase
MKFVAISDVHIKHSQDDASHLLIKFLSHQETRDSDKIFLLGDIFDLMCGPHSAYFDRFADVFGAIEKLIIDGKEVHYVEGNHDLHLRKLFDQHPTLKKIIIHKSAISFEADGKIFYLSHGDEHELDNDAYHRYMGLINSTPLTFVANYIMPLSVLDWVGNRASKMSRKKGARHFDSEKVRNKFRAGVESTLVGKADIVIGGHSHVKDDYQGDQIRYINNGYAQASKTFIFVNDAEVSFVPV